MILLHHLRIGRSFYTVWLLEELGLDYELKIYLRDPKTMRAQADMKEPHPLGKSPVIEDGEIKLAESGAITSYLIDNFDTDHKLAPPHSDKAARAEYTQWLHYPEGSAFLPLMFKLLLAREAEPKPPVFNGFATAETKLHLDYLEDFLSEKPFLLGDELTGADFGLTYIVEMEKRLGELGSYPKLDAYLERMRARPAFRQACERAGEDR